MQIGAVGVDHLTQGERVADVAHLQDLAHVAKRLRVPGQTQRQMDVLGWGALMLVEAHAGMLGPEHRWVDIQVRITGSSETRIVRHNASPARGLGSSPSNSSRWRSRSSPAASSVTRI